MWCCCMNLNALNKDIKTEKYVKQLEQDVSFENLSNYRVKDNYDMVWSDFSNDDLSDALTHAKQYIEIANETHPELRGRYLERACKDLSNYLIAAYNMSLANASINLSDIYEKIYDMWDRNVKKLIIDLAYYKDLSIDERIFEIIMHCYQLSNDEYFACFVPNYEEMYAQLGDVALFLDRDIDRAELWYCLAGIDWNGVLEENENDEPTLASEEIIDLIWWKDFIESINILNTMSRESLMFRSIFLGDKLDVSDKFMSLVKDYIRLWEDYQKGDEKVNSLNNNSPIVEILSSFYIQIEEDICEHSKECNKIKLIRTELFVFYIIQSNASYYLLCDVSKRMELDNKLKDVDIKVISKYISISDDDKILPIKQYFNNKSIGPDVEYDKVVSSLRLIYAVSICDSILKVLHEQKYLEKIAYYTSFETVEKMLPETSDDESNIGRLALMHVAYMNDPNEGKLLKEYIFKNKDSYERETANYPYVFLKCFTTRVDDLPMWEMYGDNAEGCCLVFDIESVFLKDIQDFPIFNVCYLSKKDDNYYIDEKYNININSTDIKSLEEYMGKLVGIAKERATDEDAEYRNALQRIIGRIQYLFKNADYAYECEKRVVYSVNAGVDERIRQTRTNPPLLYTLSDVSLKLDELILGPKFKDKYKHLPYLQKQLALIEKKVGEERIVPISYSSIEYK